MNLFQSIGRTALFGFDAETAHGLSIKALKTGLLPSCSVKKDPRLETEIGGLKFPNPLGLAAGYDKNAEVPDAILKLGFGFTEVGTITPRAQSGNPKPRIFRLIEDEGIINRLGFNNEGHAAALNHLEARKHKSGIVGINIGANKDSEDFTEDYALGIQKFAHLADYFTVNISSPNTPGLRDLQTEQSLQNLLDKIFSALDETKLSVPIFLKVAPDLHPSDITAISKTVSNSKLSGLMVSNTTLARNDLKNKDNVEQAGGLSGRPLFERSTIILARFRKELSSKVPIIGIGGIECAETAWKKSEAGASLVQLYSSMVYKGPGLASQIVKGLSEKLDYSNFKHISEVVGSKTKVWADKKLPEEI